MSWELVVTVMVGALLGLTVHWLRHYVRVARREHRGEQPPAQGGRDSAPPRSMVAITWAVGFAFLGLVTEDLVAHMAAEFLQPLLASLATLLPAGFILGWSMNRGRPADENLPLLLANGVTLGAVITGVTGVIWLAGFGTAPWLPLFAWWGLLGVGARALTPTAPNAVKGSEPVAAVILVFGATFVLNLLPASSASYQRFGALGTLPLILRSMAAGVQQSPGLPATFWMDAEARYLRKSAPPPADSVASSPKPESAGSVAPRVDLKGAVDRLVGSDPVDPAAKRAFYRSWLVILLFSLGMGAAPFMERSLRPVDYPNSETYRRDILLAIGMVLLLVAACLSARIDQSHMKAPAREASTVGGSGVLRRTPG